MKIECLNKMDLSKPVKLTSSWVGDVKAFFRLPPAPKNLKPQTKKNPLFTQGCIVPLNSDIFFIKACHDVFEQVYKTFFSSQMFYRISLLVLTCFGLTFFF
jgi:hypothetical protein